MGSENNSPISPSYPGQMTYRRELKMSMGPATVRMYPNQRGKTPQNTMVKPKRRRWIPEKTAK